MKEKIILLAIGSAVSVAVGVGGYLFSSFFGSYETKADANSHKSMVVTRLDSIDGRLGRIEGKLDKIPVLKPRETVLGAEPGL